MPSADRRVTRRLEARPLLAEERVIRIVGGREVRVDRVDPEMGAGRNLGERPIEVVVAEAEPVHAGVDLEVAAQRDAAGCGRGLPAPARRRASKSSASGSCSKIAVEVADAQRPEHEDRHTHAGLSQHDGFFDVRAREHRGASLLERARHLRRAVAVGVGLDDCDDRQARAGQPRRDSERWRDSWRESRRGRRGRRSAGS